MQSNSRDFSSIMALISTMGSIPLNISLKVPITYISTLTYSLGGRPGFGFGLKVLTLLRGERRMADLGTCLKLENMIRK